MPSESQRPEARARALSKSLIVRTSIEILDEGGADSLTFRTLAARLATGPGAIYHHVANKEELLGAAADEVMAAALGTVHADDDRSGLRAVMLGAFDAVRAHGWFGAQLAAAPWQPAVLSLFGHVGEQLVALHLSPDQEFDAASVLVHHFLGVASQFDPAAQPPGLELGRPAFLDAARRRATAASGTDALPFLTRIAEQLAEHDDREQFLAGVEIILAGLDLR